MDQAGEQGVEWIIDAHGCAPERLQSVAVLDALFVAAVAELRLKPVGDARFHKFPEPGGITGLLLLSESHLACHTFPETGFAAFNLYSCKPRPRWAWEERLAKALGATRVLVRAIERPAGGASDS